MLLLKPGCECCDIDLPPDSRDAMICSFECTFCRSCAEGILNGRCPNSAANCCGGRSGRRRSSPNFLPRASAYLNRKAARPRRLPPRA